jgi:hypothetical protein
LFNLTYSYEYYAELPILEKVDDSKFQVDEVLTALDIVSCLIDVKNHHLTYISNIKTLHECSFIVGRFETVITLLLSEYHPE